MARSDIYEPKQKRSIEKKNHIIIETGIELMTKKAIIIQRRMISLRQPGVLPASSTAILKINTTFWSMDFGFILRKWNRNSIFLSKQQIRTISRFLPKICLRGFWRSISITGIFMKNLRLCATVTAKWLPYTIKQRLRSPCRSPLWPYVIFSIRKFTVHLPCTCEAPRCRSLPSHWV